MAETDIAISVVVPLFNEEESVPLLVEKTARALEAIKQPHEIILVDDGSSDDTVDVATALISDYPQLRIIVFRKNFGQTPAMAAGIDEARGRIVVTMDGDLQNDPADIPMMVEKLEQGFDLVVGWRHKRKDKLITRKIPSMIANRLIGYVTGVPIRDNGCSLKAYRAELIKNSPFYSEFHRFIPALLSLSGARVAELKVRHHARQFGESKYGLSRIYKVLLDMLTIKTILSFGQHPVRWLVKIAMLPLLAAFSIPIFFRDAMLTDNVVMPTLVVLFFSLSVFLVSLGIIVELVYFQGKFRIRDVSMLAIHPRSSEASKS